MVRQPLFCIPSSQPGSSGVAKQALGYLGPYRLLNVYHTGQACQLWQAYDDGRQRMVAVKAVSDKFAKDDEQIGSLRHEFKIGKVIASPYVIEVYAFDIDRGTPYLAMEWCAAPNLKRRVRNREDREKLLPFAPKIIEQCLEGVSRMHQNSWVHRDIKPDNFLVTDEGQVKLIDFGLARKVKRGLARWFAFKGKRQGTPSYMSPEQIRCEPLDERADVYSLGCTFYELIAGTPPITGNTREELFSKHLKSPPPSIEAVDRNVTIEFSQLLKRCMAKTPAERPATAGDLLEQFRSIKVFRVQPRRPDVSGR